MQLQVDNTPGVLLHEESSRYNARISVRQHGDFRVRSLLFLGVSMLSGSGADARGIIQVQRAHQRLAARRLQGEEFAAFRGVYVVRFWGCCMRNRPNTMRTQRLAACRFPGELTFREENQSLQGSAQHDDRSGDETRWQLCNLSQADKRQAMVMSPEPVVRTRKAQGPG